MPLHLKSNYSIRISRRRKSVKTIGVCKSDVDPVWIDKMGCKIKIEKLLATTATHSKTISCQNVFLYNGIAGIFCSQYKLLLK